MPAIFIGVSYSSWIRFVTATLSTKSKTSGSVTSTKFLSIPDFGSV